MASINIPEGWTYFAHRTNTSRWNVDPFSLDVIHLDRLMSVVTENEIHNELNSYGRSHNLGYTSGEGTPFEIRSLICTMPYIRTMSDDAPEKEIMIKQFYYDKNNFGGAYGQRHHSMPKGEDLIVLGQGRYDEVFDTERNIIWTIPRSLINLFKRDLQTKELRTIPIDNPNTMEEKKK